jgi:chemotaxis protein MotB
MSDTIARPIIVIKKKGGHAGHHGGAWKVAYADFVTAMMSLFIVLWLLNSTPQVKKAIAGYFNDPRGTSKMMGTEMLGSGPSVTIDQTNVAKLAEAIKQAIIKQKELDKLADQVELRMTDEGLRIELIDGKNGSFFESGSPKLTDNGLKLLTLIAGQLKMLPNHLLIEGHTDAKPFGGENGYSNWELSSDRANSARRLLQDDGVKPEQVAQVRGYAAQSLRVPEDPLSASNRRISIVVQFLAAPPGSKGTEILNASGEEGGKEGGETKGGEGEKAKPSAADAAATKPVEVQPSTGKIDLPAIPSGAAKPSGATPKAGRPSATAPAAAAPGKASEDLTNQINQLRQMKQADAAHGK